MKLEYAAVASASGNWSYVVTIADDIPVACTCKAFHYYAISVPHYACKHMHESWNSLCNSKPRDNDGKE